MKKFIIISAVIGLILICLYGSTFGWQKLNPSVNYSQPLDSSLASRLQGHVFVLSETIGDRNMRREAALKKSGDYIMRQFKNSGLTAKRQDYSFEGQTAYNLIAEKIGTTHPKEIVLIGAHYDSRLNPGADDDASGIAVLLELAELLSPRTLSRTVKFVAFTNEEDSLFKGKDDKTGSSVYAKEARQTGELIRASIILDMVGYFTDQPFSQRYLPILGWFFPNRGNFILVAGNTLSKKLVGRIVESWNHCTRVPPVGEQAAQRGPDARGRQEQVDESRSRHLGLCDSRGGQYLGERRGQRLGHLARHPAGCLRFDHGKVGRIVAEFGPLARTDLDGRRACDVAKAPLREREFPGHDVLEVRLLVRGHGRIVSVGSPCLDDAGSPRRSRWPPSSG